jgi:hypothetical protein
MAQYTIYVNNESGYAKSYVVFMQPPQVTATGGQPTVYANAWVTFNGILSGGQDNLTYTDQTYAYWGTAQMPVAPGTTMGQGGTALVNTAQQTSVTFVGTASQGSGIGFLPPVAGGAMTGSYRIIANSDFTQANGYMFGLARPGNIPTIASPVATFVAEPNDTFNITPVIKFYVADGAYTPGEIIDFSTTSTSAAEVNFTGLPQTSAVVTQNSNGSFTVQYY